MIVVGGYFFRQKTTGAQPPQSLSSCPAGTPNHSASFYQHFYDLHPAAFFARFSKILAPSEDLLKKKASKFLSCRGGLGDPPYNKCRQQLSLDYQMTQNGGLRVELWPFLVLNASLFSTVTLLPNDTATNQDGPFLMARAANVG